MTRQSVTQEERVGRGGIAHIGPVLEVGGKIKGGRWGGADIGR